MDRRVAENHIDKLAEFKARTVWAVGDGRAKPPFGLLPQVLNLTNDFISNIAFGHNIARDLNGLLQSNGFCAVPGLRQVGCENAIGDRKP